MNYSDKLRIKDERLAIVQEHLNLMHITHRPMADIAEMATQHAEAGHAGHGQYKDYYRRPGWSLAIINRDIRSKGGLAWARRDIVLVLPDGENISDPSIPTALGHSIRLGWNCALSAHDYTLI